MGNPSHSQSQRSLSSSGLHFMKKPHACLPLLISIFLLLTWVSLTLKLPFAYVITKPCKTPNVDQDIKANLVRFHASFPSQITKDNRGWLLDPIALSRRHAISGGAFVCASFHLGEIKPGRVRGNTRHRCCNETFVIWGARTRFRVESDGVVKGYADVIIGDDEVAVAACRSGSAHALVNVDDVRTTYFIGCQDGVVDNRSLSSADFNVWDDLK